MTYCAVRYCLVININDIQIVRQPHRHQSSYFSMRHLVRPYWVCTDHWRIVRIASPAPLEVWGKDAQLCVPYSNGKSRQIILWRLNLPRTPSLWSPYVIGQTIIFSSCSFFLSSIFYLFFLSSPNLSGRTLDVYHTWCGLSANLECRSEMCGMRIAENAGPKKVAKNRQLGTIPQLCRAISSQPRHVSTIGKKLVKQQYLLRMSP